MLASKVFSRVSEYDSMIMNYFEYRKSTKSNELPSKLNIIVEERENLRYGEILKLVIWPVIFLRLMKLSLKHCLRGLNEKIPEIFYCHLKQRSWGLDIFKNLVVKYGGP